MNLCCHISDAMEGLPPRGLSCRIPSSVEYLNPNWSVTFHRTPQPFNSSQSILSESDSENDQMFLFQQRFERPLKKILITADYLDKIQWRYERYKLNYSLIIVGALSSRGKLRLLSIAEVVHSLLQEKMVSVNYLRLRYLLVTKICVCETEAQDGSLARPGLCGATRSVCCDSKWSWGWIYTGFQATPTAIKLPSINAYLIYKTDQSPGEA